jgi:hypothetical protein
MKFRISYTGIAMRNISHVIYYVHDDTTRWYKVNWIIVSTSHAMFKTRGSRGHKIRQNIRRRLWTIAQKKYPILKRYSIPDEIKGDSKCKIKIHYRLLDFFSSITRKLASFL